MRPMWLRAVCLSCVHVMLVANTGSAQDPASRIAYRGFVFGFDVGCYTEEYGWQQCSPKSVGSSVHLPDSEILMGSLPSWSPDSAHIVFARGDIYVSPYPHINYDTNITNTLNNGAPAWSPDGTRIAFVTTRDGSAEIYLMNPDGTDVRRLTSNIAQGVDGPVWSPDSRRIAFTCILDNSNYDICAINRDGTEFTRLTTDPTSDSHPTWSSDGAYIAFATMRFDSNESVIAIMSADGSGMSQPLAFGWSPAWAPDGTRIAYSSYHREFGYLAYGIFSIKADGTDVMLLRGSCGDFCGPPSGGYDANLAFVNGGAADPVWMPAPALFASFTYRCDRLTCTFDGSASRDPDGVINNYTWNFGDGTISTGTEALTNHTYGVGDITFSVVLTVTDSNGTTATTMQAVTVAAPLVASFTSECNGVTCTFDASSSQGPVATYGWLFGDGAVASGSIVTHTFSAGGTYAVTLTITSSTGATATTIQTVTPNSHPSATFTLACDRLTCSFDASASRDFDGTITNYVWNFGDGSTGTGVTPSHSFTVQGTYQVELIVTDDRGATGVKRQSIAVTRRPTK
jgi:PKD repeat protein